MKSFKLITPPILYNLLGNIKKKLETAINILILEDGGMAKL